MMEKLESFRAFPESCHYRVGLVILLDTFWIPTTEVTHMLESLLKTFWTLSTNYIFLLSLFRIICVVCLQSHKNNHQDLTRAPRGREGKATGILGSMNDWNFCLTAEAICLITVKAQRWIHWDYVESNLDYFINWSTVQISTCLWLSSTYFYCCFFKI